MSFDLYNFHQLLKENKIILSFEGTFSQGILRSMVEMLKEKLEIEENKDICDDKQQIAQKVYGTFIELAQNIQHYSAGKVVFDGKEMGTGIVLISETENYFIVNSGNLVNKSDLDKVTSHIDNINKMDCAELKKLYKTTLRLPVDKEKKGAGVGFIVIARTSENEIGYSVKSIDDSFDFLSINIKINKTI